MRGHRTGRNTGVLEEGEEKKCLIKQKIHKRASGE